MVMSPRTARESEALRQARRSENTFDDPDFSEFGDAQGKYTEVMVDPQWLNGWRLLLDENGEEYGVPVRLPAGQWDKGGINALMNKRRADGGYDFSLIEPERKAPKPTIECIVDKCGGADVGGKRKMVFTITDLIEHVETFHGREAKVYRKYLDKLADGLALQNERLQRLQTTVSKGVEPFYCEAEGCGRYFDSEQGRTLHAQKAHKGGG